MNELPASALGDGPIQGQELNLMILLDPFQLSLFSQSVIIVNYVMLNNFNVNN